MAAPKVVDSDGAFTSRAGTVFVTIGNGGHSPRTVGALGPLWASGSGTDSEGGIDIGFAQLDVTTSRLEFREVSTSGPHAGTTIDAFTIAS